MNFTNYKTRPLIFTIIAIAVVHGFFYKFLCNYQGIIPSLSTTACITSILILYDKFLWKFFPFLITVRNVSGRYEGKLISSYNSLEIFEIIIEITQSASSICVSQFTNNHKGNTSSTSSISNLVLGEDKLFTLHFAYRNDGDETRDELDSHQGFCSLRFDKKRINIEGIYFTNRKVQTKGKISAKRISSKILGRF